MPTVVVLPSRCLSTDPCTSPLPVSLQQPRSPRFGLPLSSLRFSLSHTKLYSPPLYHRYYWHSVCQDSLRITPNNSLVTLSCVPLPPQISYVISSLPVTRSSFKSGIRLYSLMYHIRNHQYLALSSAPSPMFTEVSSSLLFSSSYPLVPPYPVYPSILRHTCLSSLPALC